MSLKKIVIASDNQGKIKEIKNIFYHSGFELIPQCQFNIKTPKETGKTFLENALLKAICISEQLKLPTIADDSGLVVDALEGDPGIKSARYAGENATNFENLMLLLEKMKNVPKRLRTAAFHCSAVFVDPKKDKDPIDVEGIWRGSLLNYIKGDNGFGYDPIFYDPILMKTGAEMTLEEKAGVSHRGKAFRSLLEILQAIRG